MIVRRFHRWELRGSERRMRSIRGLLFSHLTFNSFPEEIFLLPAITRRAISCTANVFIMPSRRRRNSDVLIFFFFLSLCVPALFPACSRRALYIGLGIDRRRRMTLVAITDHRAAPQTAGKSGRAIGRGREGVFVLRPLSTRDISGCAAKFEFHLG